MPADKPAVVQTRTIKWLYIFALSMVAMLTIAGQVLVQWSLAALQGDSTIVNVAGRQRMLSQRIPRIILALDANARLQSDEKQIESQSEYLLAERSAADLTKSISLWRTNHLGLAEASETLGLARSNSRPVADLFATIDPHFSRVQQIATTVTDRFNRKSPRLLNEQERAQLIEHSDAFLTSMDAIVAQYEQEAKQRVSRLQWMERGLLVTTLLVLMCEGLFIFSPAIASLNRAFYRMNVLADQLELAREAAEQANEAKTQFLARVSHELRTPLHAILGMLSLMRRSVLSPRQHQRADLAYQASRSLRHLVDDLLDISSVENRSPIALNIERVHLAKVVKDCVTLMHGHARRKGLRLYATLNLPKDTVCQLDEFRLRQILINLIQNAIRYTSAGEVECIAWIEKSPSDQSSSNYQWLNLTIRDTGCGIATENQERIFENFVRINNSETPHFLGPRLGLGLPITASLVKAMHGTIAVESKLNGGSKFCVRFPTACSSIPDKPRRSKSKAASKSTDAPRCVAVGSQLRALVVDDSKVNRLLLRDYLKRLGIRAYSTSNLESALALYKRRSPQLVLLDLNVGRQRSLGLASTLRHLQGGKDALIFIITADAHFNRDDCPIATDITGVLHKPIEFRDFCTSIQPVLQGFKRAGSMEVEEGADFNALLGKLQQQFLNLLPSEVRLLKDAFAKHDFEMVKLIAHRIHGSAGNASLNAIANAAAQIELHINSNAKLELSKSDDLSLLIRTLTSIQATRENS